MKNIYYEEFVKLKLIFGLNQIWSCSKQHNHNLWLWFLPVVMVDGGVNICLWNFFEEDLLDIVD